MVMIMMVVVMRSLRSSWLRMNLLCELLCWQWCLGQKVFVVVEGW